MKFGIMLRKNSTGEYRMYRFTDIDWEDPDEDGFGGTKYWLTEGNLGCDCNRYLYFERAYDFEPDERLVQCSEDKYSILYARLEDNRVVPIDEEEHDDRE